MNTNRKVMYANGYRGYFLGFYQEDNHSGHRKIVALVENADTGQVFESCPTKIHFKEWEGRKIDAP